MSVNVTDLSQWTQQDFSHLVSAAVVVLTVYTSAALNQPHWPSWLRTLVSFGVASGLTVLQLWGQGDLATHSLPWLVFVVFLAASVLYKTILRGSAAELESKTLSKKARAANVDGSYTITSAAPPNPTPASIDGSPNGAQVGLLDTVTDGE